MEFSKVLITWYLQNKRHLPWRETTDPYKIWLSEIMLQQTRVAQGLPYYNKFLEAYPTVKHLALASEDEVLKLWQGLGYYSRARNLHATAKKVAFELDEKFPSTYKELKQLKGVGDYTASAIASICYHEATPVVDGNVYRVLARYFGVATPINTPAGIKEFKQLANAVKSVKQIATYNQAIMEFGATQCKPKSPNCNECPLQDSCKALQDKKVDVLPVKLKKLKVKNRYFNYLVYVDEAGCTLMQQRTQKGIWYNMYEFPLLETTAAASRQVILSYLEEQAMPFKAVSLYNDSDIVHKLSHQHLHTKFWIVPLQNNLKEGITIEKAKKLPVPVLVANFIDSFGF